MPKPAPRALGFFDGVVAFFRGVGFIVGRPSMWGWALIPMLVATALFGGLLGGAIWGGSEIADRVLTSGSGWRSAGQWVLRAVLWLVGAVLAFLVAISLAQPLSGFALDRIARRQELALGGRAWPNQPVVRSAVRSLGVTFTALAIGLPILAVLALVTFFFPAASPVTIPLKFLVTGIAIAYDFLDYPLALRGAGAPTPLGFVRRHFGAVAGFGAAAALLLLVPGIGLLVLPFGVAGATCLVVAADRA